MRSSHLAHRIQSQLSGWKSKCLTQAGRICLANYSLAPMLYYTFAPPAIYSLILKNFLQWRVIRAFVWGHDAEDGTTSIGNIYALVRKRVAPEWWTSTAGTMLSLANKLFGF